MKRIISVCSVILAFALFVTVFAACNKDKADDTSTTTVPQVADGGEYTLDVAEDKATVMKGSSVFQELSYPVGIGYAFDLEYAREHYEFVDMNFDGNADLYLAVSNVDGVISYYCWLFNATENRFDYSASLSALKNISVDSEEQLILSKVNYEGVDKVSTYNWVDGVLTYVETFGEEGATIPQKIEQSYSGNTIGETSKTEKTTAQNTDKTSSQGTTKGQSSSGSSSQTTKPQTTKPLLTTTSPANNGIELLPTEPDDGWY